MPSLAFIDTAQHIKNAQDAIDAEFASWEKAGLSFQNDGQAQDYMPWKTRTYENGVTIHGPRIWEASAHTQLIVKASELKIQKILETAISKLRLLEGYFLTTPLTLDFEKRYNGMVIYMMGFPLRGCLQGDNPKKWALPKVLERIKPIEQGHAQYEMGSHKFYVNRPEDAIKLSLILTAPKSDPTKRKKPKAMAKITRVWEYHEVMEKQDALLKNWHS